jgi:hypothetical protein
MPPTRLQLEGPSLEALLGQIQHEHGESARIVQAEKVRSGGVAGFFTREHYQIDVELDEDNDTGPEDHPAPTSVLELAERVNRQQLGERAQPAPPAISTEGAAFSDMLARLQRDTALAYPTGPSSPELAMAARGGSGESEAVAVADVAAAADPAGLLSWLQSLPVAAPTVYAPGQVIAVAGEPLMALRVATALAEELGTDPDTVLVAAPDPRSLRLPSRRRLTDPADMAARRERWSRNQHGTIVVVSAPMVLRPEGWARAALAALAPTFTWGAVAATTKVADISAWAQRLGHVDALAVEGLDATMDPASILTADIAVGMVEGRRATPHLWAALLAERLPR